jgi:putative DNA primase/helicase
LGVAAMTAAAIARALPRGRKAGNGYAACCPAHEDRNPSLSLRDVDGQILVHCHAGCEQHAVINALKRLGLWPEPNRNQGQRIVAEYNYTDETGTLLYQVLRTEPKGFFQRRPDGRGGWINQKGERQVLYRLREVLEAPIVFVVEGEKDVETIRSHGFVATTNAGGASAQWLPQYTGSLRGREVIIIPDNDQPGWKRAAIIARALFGVAAKIIVLDDIHATGAKDISDWFAAGHSECELIAMLETVHAV